MNTKDSEVKKLIATLRNWERTLQSVIADSRSYFSSWAWNSLNEILLAIRNMAMEVDHGA